MDNRFKYPRTMHLPWSLGVTDDDKVLHSIDLFIGNRVIVTEKMDGENTTGYSDGYIHARSIDGRSHPSRDWVKSFWGNTYSNLPKNWRVCGENMFAVHSISYNNLASYFYGFSIWNENNVCLSWDDTVEWFTLLGIQHVPVLYDGIFDETLIRKLYDEKKDAGNKEGYVVRLASAINFPDFGKSFGKFVRANHVVSNTHWMFSEIKANGLSNV